MTAVLFKAACRTNPQECAKVILGKLDKRTQEAAKIVLKSGVSPFVIGDVSSLERNEAIINYNGTRRGICCSIYNGSISLGSMKDREVLAMIKTVEQSRLTGAHLSHHDKEEVLLKLMKKIDVAIGQDNTLDVRNLAIVTHYLFSGEEIMGKDALLGRVFGLFCEHNLGGFLRKHGVVK